ncbi:MAG: 3-oxoacyl-[acyl-carrier-protein] synthase III C-terminal domain-containing protein [Paracoccaceae bacterium]
MRFTKIVEAFGSLELTHQLLSDEIGKVVADRIREKSGFETRYICSEDENIFNVANKSITENGLEQDIVNSDVIIVVSEYTVNNVPPPSAFLLENFNLEKKLVLDLNRGCSGFCEALIIVDKIFSTGVNNKALIITAENYSKYFKRKNRSLSPIFSDCVTFSVIEKGTKSISQYDSGSFYQYKDDLKYQLENNELYMNGPGLVSFVKSKVVPSIQYLLSNTPGNFELDFFLPHQGSKLIVETLRDTLNISKEICPFTARNIGNTNSSSIPISLKYLISEQKLRRPMNCLLSGFGVGLSYCNLILSLEV